MPINQAHSTLHRKLSAWRASCASLAAASTLLGGAAFAGDLTKDLSKSVLEEPPVRIHALFNLDFSGDYITPRGVHVENQGLVFEPIFLSFTTLYHSKDGFLQDVGLTAGVWNSIHSHQSGARLGNWNETDPIAGLTFKFAGGFEFDATYSAFFSQTHSYETCHNLSLKLTYNDKCFGPNFALNPFVEYWQELHQKASVVFDPTTADEGFYFCLGMDPTIKFGKFPLQIELPTFMNICSDDFYQHFNGTNGGSGVALFSTELKATVPLNFVKFGHWSLYAGVKYYHLMNSALLDTNQALLAGTDRERNLWQVHGGLSIFF